MIEDAKPERFQGDAHLACAVYRHLRDLGSNSQRLTDARGRPCPRAMAHHGGRRAN